ncbi:murein biosynthesis integral membrane protein MurJ [Synechococcus elongatus]|uniref:Probable lipid II flippase MurJ n=1 Tax=Synechococcus elongatus PCC 11801 TaxID=2219813 RepID=A0AAN1QNC2_SYNEL|nr:murein biosynthesis integral membrane protein MurJ [Synechococcus elongatus]AZB72355.1 murein biosynthesis integral membrane protein MurJ [Synechococcus elongatus PCC 11801]
MPDAPKPARSLAGIAGIVAVATLLSKVFGLVRQQAIAAAFGVGPAFDAYNYAYVIPGFLLILLGGINGPFHSAMVSVLAKRDRRDSGPLVETITTLVGISLLIVTVLLVIFADPLIGLVAPGLDLTPTGQETRAIAVLQLRIMAPMALLAGLIGIGFGVLNAADTYWLPSVSPLFSSLAVIGGVGVLWWQVGSQITSPQLAILGGIVLAGSTLLGAILQWVIQLPAQFRHGLAGLRLRFEWQRPEVQAVLKILGPATFSSGMLQINVYTDLFFASFIPQAAAGLGYAGLLVQTPLGILSNVILVPLLPVLSRLAEPEQWPELKQRIRQGLFLTALLMLPLGALMAALAFPIVQLVYERGAFQTEATDLVASLLVAYSIGMFVYLGRDVLVRVFYALGDGQTPFRISIFNIFLNALFDWLLLKPFGAPGLVLATVGVNLVSLIALLWILHRRLKGLPLLPWGSWIALLSAWSFGCGVLAYGAQLGLDRLWPAQNLILLIVKLAIASGVGLLAFALPVSRLPLPEVQQLRDRLLRRRQPVDS